MHQLGLVEARCRAAEMLRAEMRRHVGRGQPALDVTGVAEMEQMVLDRGAQKTALAKFTDARGAVPFGQRRPVGTDQQPHMPIARTPHLERIEHQQLSRRVGQVIVTPQHMSDPHT